MTRFGCFQLTFTGEEIEGECGFVLREAEERIRKGVAPRPEDIKEEEKDMLDFLDGAFPCWKDVRNKQ